MTLKTRMFAGQTPAMDLANFVNDNGITQANIQAIIIGVDNYLYLFYWA